MRFKRRDVLFGLVGASLPLISASCTQQTSQSGNSSSPSGSAATTGQAPAKIKVGYQVYAGSELLAKGLGTVKQAFPNSAIEYLRFDAGRDVNTALAANGIDFGVLGSAAAAVGLSQGLPYQVFYVYDLTNQSEALAVKPNITKATDLKGKKIATPFSSTSHYSLLSYLKLEGIQENELTILDLLPQDLLAAWQRGDIDGGYVWEPVLNNLEKADGKVLTNSGELAKRGYATLNIGVVHQNFAKQYPDVVKQYAAALDRSVKLYRQNPEEAGKALATELGIPAEEALRQASHVTWFDAAEQPEPKLLGTADKPGELVKTLKDTADFMASQKAIPAAPTQEAFA